MLAPPHDRLHFNVSHSAELCAIAFATDRRVGIDVELVRPLRDCLELARAHFSPTETSVLTSLPESSRLGAFFACWSSKESYVKATGEGLLLPLGLFTVEAHPDRPAALLAHERDPAEVTRWKMRRLALSPLHVSVLTAEIPECAVRVWDATPG